MLYRVHLWRDDFAVKGWVCSDSYVTSPPILCIWSKHQNPYGFSWHLLLGRVSLHKQHVSRQYLLIPWCQVLLERSIPACAFQCGRLDQACPFPFQIWPVRALLETTRTVGCHRCFLWGSRPGTLLVQRALHCLEPAGTPLLRVTRKRKRQGSKCTPHWCISDYSLKHRISTMLEIDSN